MKKVAVIGGGPSGMMAAYAAWRNGWEVTLYEKNQTLGKKLLLTGNGRCNVTNDKSIHAFLQHVQSHGKFVYPALKAFGPKDVMALMESNGCPLKKEDNDRIFPCSDKASDILDVFIDLLKDVNIITDTSVQQLWLENNMCRGIVLNQKKISYDCVILTCGGLGFPQTGSQGDGYALARQAVHARTALHPVLVPLRTDMAWTHALSGVALRHVKIRKPAIVGDILLTGFGVSGPAIFNLGYIPTPCTLHINLIWQQEDAFCRDLKAGNRQLSTVVSHYVPKRFGLALLQEMHLDPSIKISSLSQKTRNRLLEMFSNWPVYVSGPLGYQAAMMTHGGLDLSSIDRQTMASKTVSGLRFAGELLDVDAMTGGYNLQIAFSTGYLAGSTLA